MTLRKESLAVSASLHEDTTADLLAPPDQVFAHLDDPVRFGRRMSKPAAMMMGGSMTSAVDDRGGRAVGSVINITWSILGLQLAVEEVVTERLPPHRKFWESHGPQRMITIDYYRMGFSIERSAPFTRLTIFIDYVPAQKRIGRMLGVLLARLMRGGVFDASPRMQRPFRHSAPA